MAHREVVPIDRHFKHDPMHLHFLFEGIEYPTSKGDLVDFATDSDVDTDLLNLVRSLPDRRYISRDDVWRAWAEAARVFGGGGGTPRDNIGKQATAVPQRVRQP